MLDYELELRHYGVKGMKWGVRKDRRQNGFGRRVAKGRKFVNDNAPALLAAGLSVTAIAAGQSYLVPVISTGGQIVTLATKLPK